MKMRTLARWMGASGLRTILGGLMPWSGVLCLNYHRVGHGADSLLDRDVWSADADEFDDQIAYLKSRFDVVAADDLPDVLARKRGRFVMVTFDDGYRDNYDIAFRILRDHGVRASFFLVTGFLDHPRLSWWDEIAWMIRTSPRASVDLHPWLSAPVLFDEPDRDVAVRTVLQSYKRLPSARTAAFLDSVRAATGSSRCDPESVGRTWMTWDMVREMRAAGMSIGGHTANHALLARMPHGEQQREIVECGRRLDAELGEPMRAFSYPGGKPGDFDDGARAGLREAGVRFAFSYYGGIRAFDDWDDYDIRRIAVERYVAGDLFRAVVSLPHFFGRPTGRRLAAS